jgi:glutathionylspermidine synthase
LAGYEVVLGDAANVRRGRRGLTLCGVPITALYRYVPFEPMLGTPLFTLIYDAAVAGQVRLLNGLGTLLLQHKGLMAWLWEHRDDPQLTEGQRRAVVEHLPPTWRIEDGAAGPREGLVAKQVFGREGEEVRFGEDCSEETWAALRRQRTHIVQRKIDVKELAAVVPTSTGQQLMPGRATIGSFAVRGQWAGFYTRFGGKIVTSRAKWMATFVEA